MFIFLLNRPVGQSNMQKIIKIGTKLTKLQYLCICHDDVE